jgi:effector-binding domain-containing protein
MISDVAVKVVPARPVAVVREYLRWTELGRRLIPLLDRVYVAVRAGKVVQTGQNVFIYRDATREGANVEVGVEVGGRFAPVDDVVFSETPAGEVAAVTHTGPYSNLKEAHDAVMGWCRANGRAQTGTSWEVYGDWREDPAELETEVYYALRPQSGG